MTSAEQDWHWPIRHSVATLACQDGCVHAIHTDGRVIHSVDNDSKSLVHCYVGPQYKSYIVTLIHHVHIWVKVHTSNCKQEKRTMQWGEQNTKEMQAAMVPKEHAQNTFLLASI